MHFLGPEFQTGAKLAHVSWKLRLDSNVGLRAKKQKQNLNGFIYLQTRETTVQAHGLC